MIEAIALTAPHFHLNFMLVPSNQQYIEQLQKLSQQIAPDRVTFHDPVHPTEIVKRIQGFDIGFFLLPHTSFSYEAALPNKFFEFINAGLAVCIGPSPEMAHLAKQYQFGIVAPSFQPQAVANLLNNFEAAQIDQMKHHALQARLDLNADVEMAKLQALYAKMVASPH